MYDGLNKHACVLNPLGDNMTCLLCFSFDLMFTCCYLG